jgi:RNA ligase (TIGR02306 family)
MERKLVTIQKIDNIKPIEGADKIELAIIKGWQVVVQKGLYKIGELILFYEIDSFLPVIPEYDFLLKGNKSKKMLVDGIEKEGIRLRTVKLRKQISQGLVMPLSLLGRKGEIGEDISAELGVIKWEPPISANLTGLFKGNFPYFIPKTDEERIQNIPDILNNERNIVITEKIDGCSVTFFKNENQFGICSRNLELKEGETTQWKFAKENDLINKLPEGYAIQGELVGEGIQGNNLKLKGHNVYFFNVFDIKNQKYLDFIDFRNFIKELNLEIVPVITENGQLPQTLDYMLNFAEGKSILNENVEREGIVVRTKTEEIYKGERFSFKVISNQYLLKEK